MNIRADTKKSGAEASLLSPCGRNTMYAHQGDESIIAGCPCSTGPLASGAEQGAKGPTNCTALESVSQRVGLHFSKIPVQRDLNVAAANKHFSITGKK